MNMRTLRFPFTTAALLLAVIVITASLTTNINFIEVPFGILDRIEQHEIDDIVTAVLLVLVAVVADRVTAARRRQRELELEDERIRVVQVTMRTVQDIVNNCLNQLQLVRMEAEDHVSPETLALFDQSIQDTAAQLRALGDITKYAEEQMVMGPGLSVTPDQKSGI